MSRFWCKHPGMQFSYFPCGVDAYRGDFLTASLGAVLQRLTDPVCAENDVVGGRVDLKHPWLRHTHIQQFLVSEHNITT